mgnify:CR=1 FL=1
MKNQTIMNRKSAKKLLMVQWSRFQNVCIELEGSTLVTGVNGSGKSTLMKMITGWRATRSLTRRRRTETGRCLAMCAATRAVMARRVI